MTDKPIIFSAPMVRGLLDGRKTQTRRLLKKTQGEAIDRGFDAGSLRLPYAPGDRLYVREAWRAEAVYDDTRPRDIPDDACMVRYEADGAWTDRDVMTFAGRLRPSIILPRWASRITLTVTEVRVQRLQEISAADSIAEGVECETCTAMKASACNGRGCFASIAAYRDLWNSLHGPDAWDANPWICALTFTVQHGNIDLVKS